MWAKWILTSWLLGIWRGARKITLDASFCLEEYTPLGAATKLNIWRRLVFAKVSFLLLLIASVTIISLEMRLFGPGQSVFGLLSIITLVLAATQGNLGSFSSWLKVFGLLLLPSLPPILYRRTLAVPTPIVRYVGCPSLTSILIVTIILSHESWTWRSHCDALPSSLLHPVVFNLSLYVSAGRFNWASGSPPALLNPSQGDSLDLCQSIGAGSIISKTSFTGSKPPWIIWFSFTYEYGPKGYLTADWLGWQGSCLATGLS